LSFWSRVSYSRLERKTKVGSLTNWNAREYKLAQGVPMKDPCEVLQQKEADLARVRNEIGSLRLVAPLLSDEVTSDELTKKPTSAEKPLEADSEATGTEGQFSSIPAARPSFWKS
jgi:hypothetical protein